MNGVLLDYDHRRARKARFAARLPHSLSFILNLVALLMIVAAALLLVMGEPLGWVVAGFAALPYGFRAWYEYDLKDIAPLASTLR